MRRKIGLALGSGAARGLSQIGVLYWLEERNIEVSALTGCSIGALIGGLFAAGFSPDYLRQIALSARKTRYMKPAFNASSLLDGQGLEHLLKEVLDELQFEELPTPFACVAADLDSGEEIIFKEGSLVTAIRASMSIPAVFPPVEVDGMRLVDGGILNPVPMDLAFELGAERVIGVNVSKPVYAKRVVAGPRRETVRQRVGKLVQQAIKKGPRPIAELLEHLPLSDSEDTAGRGRRFYHIMADCLTIFSSRLLSLQRLQLGPHIIIEPPVGTFRAFDFERAEELIEIGYREMESREEEVMDFLKRR